MLDKDDILEALFDGLGVGDAEWRNRLSRAADEVLRRLADQTAGAVLASFWRHPQVTGESGTPTGWLSSLSGKIVEVYCACSPEIAAERFSARKRHDGHLDQDKRSDEILATSWSWLPVGLSVSDVSSALIHARRSISTASCANWKAASDPGPGALAAGAVIFLLLGRIIG
jgi:hypothetical protein